MKLSFVPALVLLICCVGGIVRCGNGSQVPNTISTNSQTSQCGGFKQLSKKLVMPYAQDTSEYCKAERLLWTYSPSGGRLDLLLTRVPANCGSKLEMSVEKTQDSHKLKVADTRDPNGGAGCDCAFDVYCEVPDISQDTLTLTYLDKSYFLNLDSLSGIIVVDTTDIDGACSIK